MQRVLTRRFVLSTVIASAGVAIISALIAWPLRQTGSRASADAFIPFRALSVEEATLLATQSWNGRPLLRYVAKDDDEVVVATPRYVLAAESAADQFPSANWGSYLNVHALNRKAFEAATGLVGDTLPLEPLTREDVVSFDSRRLGAYIAAEIGFATVVLTALVFALYTTRKRWWLPVVSAWTLAYLVALHAYSPAFFDADYFHQRLFVEAPGPYLLMFCVYSAPLAALVTFGLAVYRMREMRQGTHAPNLAEHTSGSLR